MELKARRFRPDQLGQLAFYVELVDDRLRQPCHAETVGILLAADKHVPTVRYALRSQNAPVAVASYDLLPPEVRASLPSEERMTTILTTARRADG